MKNNNQDLKRSFELQLAPNVKDGIYLHAISPTSKLVNILHSKQKAAILKEKSAKVGLQLLSSSLQYQQCCSHAQIFKISTVRNYLLCLFCSRVKPHFCVFIELTYEILSICIEFQLSIVRNQVHVLRRSSVNSRA